MNTDGHQLDNVVTHGDVTNVSPVTSRDEQPSLRADSPPGEIAKPAAEPEFVLRRSSRQTKPIDKLIAYIWTFAHISHIVVYTIL